MLATIIDLDQCRHMDRLIWVRWLICCKVFCYPKVLQYDWSQGIAFCTRLHVYPLKTQIFAWRCFGTLAAHRLPSKDSDQPRHGLIWVFARHTWNLVEMLCCDWNVMQCFNDVVHLQCVLSRFYRHLVELNPWPLKGWRTRTTTSYSCWYTHG